MRNLKIIGMAVLAACALSVAVAGQASASLFLASAVGALILSTQLNTHIFKTDAGNVECTKAVSHGTTTALASLTQLQTVTYTGCTAFGSGVTITKAEYEFNADGTASVLNNVVITSSIGKCSVKVGPTGNENLGGILYLTDPNNNLALIIKTHVSGISYLSSGGICGPTGELTNGTYNGESLVILDPTNGNPNWLAWDA